MTNCVFKCLVSNKTIIISNCQALEAVDRGSGTKFQVSENLNLVLVIKCVFRHQHLQIKQI